MARGQLNSFDRIFSRPSNGRDGENGSPPSVHELFSAAMRDEITLRDFAEALASCHGIRLTSAAVRLLTSVDATSGRLSFTQFQRALQEPEDGLECGAGKPLTIADQASAIISDNSGRPMPRAAPSQLSAHRPATDISADPFIKQQVLLERAAAKGPFPGNPVVQTNQASAGNPFVAQRQPQAQNEELYGGEEMANTATRMFVGGDLSREEFEGFLTKCGVQMSPESELRRLITTHEKVGNGNFMQFKRALNREMEIADTSRNGSER